MNDWLHNLPIVWMALLIFGLTALVTAAIYVVVMGLSVGERARSFKAVSPGLLPPLGILFALFMAFTASQVWSDNDKANSAVDHEASALRAVVILAAAFPARRHAGCYASRSDWGRPSLREGWDEGPVSIARRLPSKKTVRMGNRAKPSVCSIGRRLCCLSSAQYKIIKNKFAISRR